MSRNNQACVILLAAFFCTAAAFAGPPPMKPAHTFEAAEVLSGQVIDLRTEGREVLLTLGDVERVFKVKLASDAGQPISFRAQAAQIFYWEGNLVVIAADDGRAFHFSIPGYGPPRRSTVEEPQKPDAGEIDVRAPQMNSWNLDAMLRSQLQLTRVATATAIISREGPGALVWPKDDIQDYTPGGGGSGCGRSCSTTCVDGQSCSASCIYPNCAVCKCPASCSCI